MSVVDTPPPHDPLHSGPFFDWSRHMQVCIQHCPSTEPYLIQDTVSQLLHPSYNIHIGNPLKRCAAEESLTLVCKRSNEATSGCEAKQTWNIMEPCLECVKMIEGSLEVKLPTIWRDEKQSREEAERRERLEERRSEEKESEERRCRCAKR